MNSIPLALTWEFWRQALLPLLVTASFLLGVSAMIYRTVGLIGLDSQTNVHLSSLHASNCLFIAVGLSAAICHATVSPRNRFALPVSIRISILVPMINGAIAVVIAYLAIALLLNYLFGAHWTLVKPAVIAMCVLLACQTGTWMVGSLPMLRGGIAAAIATGFGAGVLWLHSNNGEGAFLREWHTFRRIDVVLAMIIPVAAFVISFTQLTLARRGQVFSMTPLGQWLLMKLDVRWGASSCPTTPMAAERWREWTRRGRAMPAGALLVAIVLCCCFLSGRIDWQSAMEAVAAFTWMQVTIGGGLFGLFLGHVGNRFDFDEHPATRPLSDAQLADVKLSNAWKSLVWTWVVWALGIGIMGMCLAVAGQGPSGWAGVFPPGTPPYAFVLLLLLLLYFSWTITSLAVAIAILRPWMVTAVFLTLASFPLLPLVAVSVRPDLEGEIFLVLQWVWAGTVLGGTGAMYVAALRLRLLTVMRVVIVGLAYLLLCAIGLDVARLLPPGETSQTLAIGWFLSSCLLPFVSIAAVPLAIWWNRHR